MKIELINFINLELAQKEMILEWRNSIEIRKWMYNDEIIGLQPHLNFIESLKTREDKLYFLVLDEDEPIGVIDFNDIQQDSLIMGIYANPNKRGVGRILLKTLIDYAFGNLKVKVIISEVFSENIKAYNLYREFGFVERGKKEHKSKEVISMKLEADV